MKQFLSNLHYAWTHGNDSEEITEYDIIGALCVCAIFVALFLIISTIDYNF